MAEKRVSVRLAAVGGKQVRAELEGIGEASKRGFGKASREMEIASAKLAKFARRAKIAAGIMTAAAVSGGIAMVRSGLQVIDEQAKLAASLGTTTASLQVLARAADLAGVSQGEVEQATIMMTKSLSQAAQGIGPAVKALEQLHLSAADLAKLPIDQKLTKIQDAIQQYVPAAQRAAVASQIFGARAGLIFSRIDSATLRQATKDVKDFGVAVSEQDAAQIQRTNDALSRMGLVWKGIANQLAVAAAPALEAMADAFAAVAKTTGPLGRAIKGLFNRLGEIATIAATFAGVLGVRLVASLTAAALGVGKLALSMKVLRAAIIRTGIGALIVGAGELLYWFGRLARGAGGFGNALGLLKDVAAEVWTRIGDGAWSVVLRMRAVGNRLKATRLKALAAMQDRWARFLKTISGALFKIPGMDGLAMDIGLDAAFAGQAVDQLRKTADEFRFYAGNLGNQADILAGNITRPLESMTALRAAMNCQIRPGVETATKTTAPKSWGVNGVTRSGTHLISTDGQGKVNYGGTPADFSVVQAIKEMKARGYRVTFYPFLLMDIPAGNTLPNPYSDNAATVGQPAHPWRGRITCSPAAGFAGTVDKTADAATQVAAFFGNAQISDFAVSGETVSWTGGNDWGFRRMILHYAHLCAAAGGVDAFLIGSELRGLTTIRDSATGFPAVAAMKQLAADVRAILGTGAKISYAADWSEYFGHQAFYAPTPIVLTANGGSFTGGDVRIAIQYLLPTAPAA